MGFVFYDISLLADYFICLIPIRCSQNMIMRICFIAESHQHQSIVVRVVLTHQLSEYCCCRFLILSLNIFLPSPLASLFPFPLSSFLSHPSSFLSLVFFFLECPVHSTRGAPQTTRIKNRIHGGRSPYWTRVVRRLDQGWWKFVGPGPIFLLLL